MGQSNEWDQWIVQANITDFKRKLEAESDPDKRRILELIGKEEAKLIGRAPG